MSCLRCTNSAILSWKSSCERGRRISIENNQRGSAVLSSPAFCPTVWNLLYLDHTQKSCSAEEPGHFMKDWNLLSDKYPEEPSSSTSTKHNKLAVHYLIPLDENDFHIHCFSKDAVIDTHRALSDATVVVLECRSGCLHLHDYYCSLCHQSNERIAIHK